MVYLERKCFVVNILFLGLPVPHKYPAVGQWLWWDDKA
jgi:hypothetical protein